MKKVKAVEPKIADLPKPKKKMGRPTAAEQRKRKADDPEVIEDNGKPRFENRMTEFGDAFIKDIHKRIVAADGPEMLRNWMIRNYRGDLKIPVRDTIAAYIKMVKPGLTQTAKNKTELSNWESSAEDIKIALNRLRLMDNTPGAANEDIEKLRQLLFIRLQKISNFQEGMMDVGFEMALIHQCRILKELAEIVLESRDDLNHYSYMASVMVEMYFQELFPLLKQAFENNADPAKTKSFLEEVGILMDKIDRERITREAGAKADENDKKGITHV